MALTLVQSAPASGISGTSLSGTFGSPTTIGNSLVVCIGAVMGTVTPTVSAVTIGGSPDNFVGSEAASSGANCSVNMWTDYGLTVSSTAIAITLTGGSGSFPVVCACLLEFAGPDSGSAPDGANGTTSSTGTSYTSNSITTAHAADLLVGMVFATGTPTGPGSPWTNLAAVSQTNSTVTGSLVVGYQASSATGSYSYAGSMATGKWGAGIIAQPLLASTFLASKPSKLNQAVNRSAVW